MEAVAPVQAPEGSPTAPAAPTPERPSQQIQALMRKETERVKKEQALKAQMAQFESEKKAFEAERLKVAAFEQNWKDNPLKAVLDRGLTPEELWLMQQRGGQMTPEVQMKLMQQRLDAQEQMTQREKEETHKREQESAEQQLKQAEAEELQTATDLLEDQKDKYPLTHAENRADLVLKVIERHYDKTLQETGEGEYMTIDDAFKQVEGKLRERAKRLAEIYQKTVAAEAPPPSSQQGRRYRADEEHQFFERSPGVERPVKTLAQVQPTMSPTISRYKSEEEREANALALLRDIKRKKGLL